MSKPTLKRRSMSRVLPSLLLLLTLMGCGGSTADKGQALAKKSIAVADQMGTFYADLSLANTSAKEADVRQAADILGRTPTAGPTLATDPLIEFRKNLPRSQAFRRDIQKAIEARAGVAKSLKECATALENLSKFDMKTGEAAAQALTASLNGLAGTFNLPAVPPKLFNWLLTAIIEAQRNRDIKKAALAIRWAVFDLALVYEVELGEWAPTGDDKERWTSPGRSWEKLWLEPSSFDPSKLKYPEVPLVNYASEKITRTSHNHLEIKTAGVVREILSSVSEQSLQAAPEEDGAAVLSRLEMLVNQSCLPDYSASNTPDIYAQPASPMGLLLLQAMIGDLHFLNLNFQSGSKVNYEMKIMGETLVIQLTPDSRSDRWDQMFLTLATRRIEALSSQIRSMQAVHRGLLELVVEHDKLFGVPEKARRPVPELEPKDVEDLSKSVSGLRLLRVWKGKVE